MAKSYKEKDGIVQPVGESIAPDVMPTDLPKAGQVAAPEATAAEQQAPAQPAPSDIPEGFEPLPDNYNLAEALQQGGFQPVPDDIQLLPSFADGSTPESPINKSPVELVDRLKMAAGNKVGNLKYLKNRFGDAKLDKRGNYVVLKDGAWHRVDADGLGDGDAWERTKELLADVADLGDVALSAAGGTAGAALGSAIGPAGSIAGAGLGAGASEAMRSSLGRLVGTYDATPEEQVKDIGWEALLGMGGQTVALGAKPTYQALKGAFESYATSATNVSKEMLSGLWSQLLGQPRAALRAAMDDPKIIDLTQEALKKLRPGTSPVEALDLIQGNQNSILTSMASEADRALKGRYKQALTALIDKAPETFSGDVKAIMNKAKVSLAEAGYGRIEGNPGKEIIKPLSQQEIAAQLGVPEANLPQIIGTKTRDALNEMTNIINDYGSFGELKGKLGASKMVELRKALNESFSELTTSETPDNIKRIIAQAKTSIDEGIGQAFTDADIGQDFIKMNRDYSQYKDAVDLVKKAVNSSNPNDTDVLVKKLVSKAGAFKTLKDEAKSLGDLVGGDKVRNLVDLEHSKSFVDFVPKSFGGNSATTLGKLAGAVTQQSNPRAVGAQIKYGNKLIDFLKSAGPRQVNAVLSDERALSTIMQTLTQAAGSEDQLADMMLRQKVQQ